MCVHTVAGARLQSRGGVFKGFRTFYFLKSDKGVAVLDYLNVTKSESLCFICFLRPQERRGASCLICREPAAPALFVCVSVRSRAWDSQRSDRDPGAPRLRAFAQVA